MTHSLGGVMHPRDHCIAVALLIKSQPTLVQVPTINHPRCREYAAAECTTSRGPPSVWGLTQKALNKHRQCVRSLSLVLSKDESCKMPFPLLVGVAEENAPVDLLGSISKHCLFPLGGSR